jgi:hypothetical protein
MPYKRLYQFQEIDEEQNVHNDQDKLFSTAPRLRNPHNQNQGLGMCLAISCDWAKTSLQYRGVTLRGQLNPGRWPIIQSAYQLGARVGSQFQRAQRAIEASGLTVVTAVSVAAGDSEVVADRLRQVAGHCIFCMIENGGHAMGYRYEAGSAEFVDPDTGHWKGDLDDILDLVIRVRLDTRYFVDEAVATMLLYEVGSA